jgi:hypothetical protein
LILSLFYRPVQAISIITMRLLFAFATLVTLVSAGEAGLRRHLAKGGKAPKECLAADIGGCTGKAICTYEHKKQGEVTKQEGVEGEKLWCKVYTRTSGGGGQQETCIDQDQFVIADGDGGVALGSGCYAWTTVEP